MINIINSLKIQFSTLVFKRFVLTLIATTTIFTKAIAHQNTDSVYANTLYDSAIIYYRNTNYKEAICFFDKIFLIKDKIPEDINPEYFKVYNWLGLINKKQGNFQKAIEYYRYALENTTDGYYITLINDNIANIYSLKGDYTKAIYYFENTLAVLENSNKESKYHGIINNYHSQGYAYLNSGQMKLALEKSLKGIQIAEENQISVGGLRYNNCALIYQNLDSTDQANYYYKKAIKSSEKEYGKNHYETALAYMYYGVSFNKHGNYEAGLQLYQKSLKILLNNLGHKHFYTSQCLMYTGNLYYQTKNYMLALGYYQKSLISKINNFNNSSIYANPSSNVFPDLDLLNVLKAKAQALEMLATQEHKETNLKAALSTLELTVGFIEQLRTGYLYEGSKLKLAAKEHETYLSIISIAHSLYEISGDTKYTKIAFKYAEHSRYAILRELKNEEMARGIAGVPDSITGNERKIKEQISVIRMEIGDESKTEIPDKLKIDELNEKTFGLTQELENLMQELESNYPKYYKQKYSNEVVSLTQLQKALDKKEAVLEYVLSDSSLYTFTITKDTFTLLKQNADSVFHSSLDFYKTALHREHSSNYYEYRDAAYNLYKKLIYPVEPLLKNKNLLIIPDDQMNFISFDVLIDKPYNSADRPDYRKESYLLQKYPISYAYSSTLYFNSLSGKSNTSPKFLGIAPSYENSKDSLQHMPLGLKSARNIALLTFGKSLTGNNVTESKFRKYSKKYGIIHFYAHGFEDTLNPANSKLYLSPSTDTLSDAYLYAWEVYNMQLNARLVVLASCYSGAGNLSKGEGVMSIGRSFINAGSETVIMSLWEASYKPTITILNYFYRNLLKGMQKDEALRHAKLKYLEETDSFSANPRFWAGIIIIGNQLALYKAWYIKKIISLLILSGLIFLLIKKRKSLFKLKN